MIQKALVIAVLAILAVIAGLAPFLQRPAGLTSSVGLATFQISVAAAVGLLSLVLLLVASASGIFWAGFLQPQNYRRGALQSLRYAALVLTAGIILFISIVAIGIVYFFLNVGQPPWATTLDNWVRGLATVAAVGGGVLVVRAAILFVLALLHRRQEVET